MFVAWQRKPLSERGREHDACSHPTEGLGRETITPVVRRSFRVDGRPRNIVVARPAVGIRLCCAASTDDPIGRGRFWRGLQCKTDAAILRLGGDMDAADPHEIDLYRNRMHWLRAELAKVVPELSHDESRLFALYERDAPFRDPRAAPSGTRAERLAAARRRLDAYMGQKSGRGFVERWWLDRDPPPTWYREPERNYMLWAECVRRLMGEDRWRRDEDTWRPNDEAAQPVDATGNVLKAVLVLGLRWPCSAGEAKAAYRRAAAQHHPDRNLGDEVAATERMKRVNWAYEELKRRLRAA